MTNPPVPATPLDVEACVRLLNKPILSIHHASWCPHREALCECGAAELEAWVQDARAIVRALASALPGMGKDSEPKGDKP